jgi:hypothetical protein
MMPRAGKRPPGGLVDRGLLQHADALSAPGSVLLYDVVGTALLEAPFLPPTLELMQKL